MLDNDVKVLIVYFSLCNIDLNKYLVSIAVVDCQGDIIARYSLYINRLLTSIFKFCMNLVALALSKITRRRTHSQLVGTQYRCGVLLGVDDRYIRLYSQSLRIQGFNGNSVKLIADDLPALNKVLHRIFRIKDIRIDQLLDNGAIQVLETNG